MKPVMRRRARWMGPVMVVVAGMAAGAGPAAAAEIEIPEWRKAFVEQGVAGSVVVRRLGENRSYVSDLDHGVRGYLPASTFKIPHLLIALETGVVRDLQQVVPWDGRERRVAAWNRDRSVQQAVAVSSVPVFQTIARSIGEDRMATWLQRLGYGNAAVSGGLERFWLDGGLRVTPLQQVDFVERLLLGTLPASTRSQIAARDAVPGERLACDVAIRGKTGWAHRPGDDGPDTGWWVGWVERPHDVWLFATVVEGYPERIREARRAVTLNVLGKAGILPGIGSTGGCSEGAVTAALPASVPE
ncbi:beta-lactamase [Thalassobaculum fulvum]|uniref:beta-lactamase n=1 Tax=Thalassobaculum fulvum TaxID=1633335 RepID=A0A919CQ82_9PROT|nr:class D beta-lactamase [Thalassobaculum fulvum]GHD47142.1 beta-lactamase [Thalassobaculum fulvum]